MLPSQLQSITASRPVPSYTSWLHNLSKVVTQLLPRVQEFNPRPVAYKSNALPIVWVRVWHNML